MSMLRGEFEVEQEVLRRSITESKLLDEELLQDRGQMMREPRRRRAAYRQGTEQPAGAEAWQWPRLRRRPRQAARKTPRKPVAWKLRLYVAGQTPKSVRAFANLKVLCDEHLKGRYQIEVIDILDHPDMARGDQIVAIPTLVIKLPQAVRKIIGDLSDTDKVLVGLALQQVV